MPASVRVFTTEGIQSLEGLTATERSLVARHWNALRRFLEQGEEAPLRQLRNTTVSRDASRRGGASAIKPEGYTLETNLDVIEWHATRGQVAFESIYDEVV